jgi:hypothetical protein
MGKAVGVGQPEQISSTGQLGQFSLQVSLERSAWTGKLGQKFNFSVKKYTSIKKIIVQKLFALNLSNCTKV